MKKALLVTWLVIIPAILIANDFVMLFMERCAETNRPLNNVNIGKAMLERMAENTNDEELKEAFSKLNSIRIISSDSRRDSRYYFRKADELIKEAFAGYREVVSVNEQETRLSVWIKEIGEKEQDIILLSLDEEDKFTVITVTGEIDFRSIARLSGSLKNEPELMKQTDQEQ
ncbi:MAG: DUF4252 domain-containing protein [bacterium]|jgi:hypothetical protein|nr:DUF4252 domain-containing protein [bacterium]MDD3625291.1 DUF4252 domain-containing protein [Proteiniphilum sp.]MDD3968412.1 DUF4252 domain-containing protein [Proteiniphilum sp.]MDD4487131.1 DUF4252 domain-containing protein [Methanothrix soehngenii]